MNNNKHPKQSKNAKYVVMDEHTLGYVMDEAPNYIGVLAGSVKRGGRNPLDGPAIIAAGITRLRPATEVDFEFFRVAIPIDFVWADGGCERDRWDAGQQVIHHYVWPTNVEIIGRRGWNLVTRQHLQCFVDVCYLGSGEPSCNSGRMRLDFHVEFDKNGAVSEAYALDMHEKIAGYRGDVDFGPAVWTGQYEQAAAREGWMLSDRDRELQVQRIVDPEAYREATDRLPPELESDNAAFRIVANGQAPHHLAARAILKGNNCGAYAGVMAYKTYQASASAYLAQ
ncbi:hypothetical protein A8H39_00075 [Paraburkholderia fungorum]|uniref:hypothetical protein n=1 Tax=Paraburkholderia fungorum TaxID=134537 RepID=UPI000482E8DB|nr:hypothetical protein [Paraburkholderia fungorum]PNE59582.1 hypothetical protein A8H39_00075 [Paraburkholderia fungorum]